ncbi:MAG: ribosome biogenesis GTPase Der [Polyangiaceae bacterium]|jgi:GTPase
MTKHHPSPARRLLPGGSGDTPIVAIVGRPNVGKSTLFNRLARAHIAIVHDEPGVTRDRKYADTSAFGKRYTLVDTGGFDPEDDDPMKAGIARQVLAVVREADAVIFVVDATTGPTEADRAAAKLLRKNAKVVFCAANKADSPRVDADAYDLYRLGVDTIFPVSALHGRGIGDLEAALVEALPDSEEELPDDENAPPRVALVGRPNAGKSSLLNRVLGEDRVLVDERPGTTRDAIDAIVERDGQRYVFIDTAGIRRKAKVAREESAVESLSVLAAIRSIERAHIVVMVCDAKEGVAEQDAKILGLAEERGRAIIVALNKCDLLSKTALVKAEENAREKLAFVSYVPIVRTSAKTGRGLSELFATMGRVQQAFRKRVTTGELNRFFEQVIETRPPPTMGGRAPRIYYVTQAQVAPPTFVAMTSVPDSIHFSYRRYVTNQLRERFAFEGVPIRVHYRARRRRDAPT